MAMVDMKQIHALEDETELLARPHELRQRAAEHGCLFFSRTARSGARAGDPAPGARRVP